MSHYTIYLFRDDESAACGDGRAATTVPDGCLGPCMQRYQRETIPRETIPRDTKRETIPRDTILRETIRWDMILAAKPHRVGHDTGCETIMCAK
jgi:hypothetical protein